MSREYKVWFDTETKSECDLKTHGAYRYAEHPTTDMQLFSYAFDDGPTSIWSKEDGEPMPKDLKDAFRDPSAVFWAWNVQFDRNILEYCLKIKLPIQRYRCAMACALSHGLPGSLEKCGDVLGIREDAKKLKEGKRLVQLFCKPRKQKDGSLKWATPQTHPEDWAKYKTYCDTDVIAMREIVKKIPKWNYPYNENELNLWFLDQTVNSRGMNIDLELANAAMIAINEEQANLARRTKRMTGDKVTAASQRDALLDFIAEHFGIDLPNMQKATLKKLVADDDLPPMLRELLQVRLDTCTTSTAKYKKLVQATNSDNRLRGTIQYGGASRTLRDCIAEGTPVTVLTEDGEILDKPIESVLLTDKVWDGIEWVSHEGVIYKGVKEVIEYKGLVTTPDHKVFLSDEVAVPMIKAKTERLELWSGNAY